MSLAWLEVKLYLDEDLPHYLAEVLRQKGYDAVNTIESSNLALSDKEQLKFATAQGRAILTFNIGDFANLSNKWYTQGKEHYGIIISQQFSKREFGELLRRTLHFLDTFTADEAYNNFLYLSP